ncbi:MAG: ATP-binding protein [Acidimicrobiales bacterium]
MKCRVCREPAIIDIRRHNANFCSEHFLRLCRDQVAKAIKDFDMLAPGERVLVAVSGGKDSLALWDLLLDMGYDADGLYIGLGIGDYSDDSGSHTRRFAESRGARLIEIDLRDEYGYDIPAGARAAKRVPCSACGLSKRHVFDRVAVEGGYDAVATGHNLDDEAAVLFGNVLNWQVDYLARQLPVLAERNGFPRKVKPLVRLGEREMAAYCVIRGIDYQVDECPMAAGNRHLAYKDALTSVETRSPGAKHTFYFGFLDRAVERFREGIDDEHDALEPCTRCGAPTPTEVCAFCRLVDRAGGHQPVAVTLGSRRGTPTHPTAENPNGDE